jgi:hypothetical protein
MGNRIITPEFRSTFVALMRPKAGKNDDGTANDKMKYSVRAAFPPTADILDLKTEASAAAKAKWGANIPKSLKSPFRRNGDLDNPIEGIGDDWIIMTFSSNEEYFNPRFNLVDGRNNPIMDETEVYSGAWFRAAVNAGAYEMAGNKGVAFYLQNIQKTRDDEAIGGGRVPASKTFSPVGGAGKSAEPKSAGDVFM